MFREQAKERRSSGAGPAPAPAPWGLAASPASDIRDPLLALEVRPVEEGVVVRLRGDLDVSTVFELREVLAQVLSEGAPRQLVLDLFELNYIDSMGLSVFLLAAKRAQASGFRFALANPNTFVSQLLEISGLTDTLDVVALPPLPPWQATGSQAHTEQGPVWESVPGVATL